MTLAKREAPTVLRASFEFAEADLVLRAADGRNVEGELRDELLARVAAGQHVELELDIMPFRQRDGERNRNKVRFRKGALRAMGRSGKGMPFLRDHRQAESLAVGGYITKSTLEPELVGGAEEWRLHQTIRLSAPWAVDLALRGLIKFFSIGWDPTGPALCTACGLDYFDWRAGCTHVRGQVLEDGTVVEIEYQDAVLVETSCLPVPAVLGTEVEEIRAAALAAAGRESHHGHRPHEETMHLLAKLAPILLLAATASENEVANAVESVVRERDALKKELAVADAENKILAKKVEEFEAAAMLNAENDFIRDALATGRIGKGDEEVWRDLFKASPDRARERMAARRPGLATPVGQPRQSDKPEPNGGAAAPASDAVAQAREAFANAGVNYDQARKYAAAFGAKDPDKALAKHAAGVEV